MRKLLSAFLTFWAGVAALSAATTPLYIQSTPLYVPPAIAPQIDATAFLNVSIFSVSPFGAEVPYQILNNQFFTNRGSGVISGFPGFNFDFYSNSVRLAMNTWINQGTIQGGTWVTAWATNLTNRGAIGASYEGLVSLQGGSVGISRSVIATGDGRLGSPAPDSVKLIPAFWGVGTNNVYRDTGNNAPRIDTPALTLPSPVSLPHRVQSINGINRYFVGQNSVGGGDPTYGAFVWSNQVDSTTFVTHVAFVQTNSFFDPNLTTEVGFIPDAGDPASVVIGVTFSYPDFDPVTQTVFTNGVYALDNSAYAGGADFQTNISLGFKLDTLRPVALQIGQFGTFGAPIFGTLQPPNAPFTNTTIYGPQFLSNRVGVAYFAYGVEIPPIASTNNGVPNFYYDDPTNYPGRIEILGDSLNLETARIRAESTAILKSKNVTSNKVALVDAPFIVLDWTSLQPTMIISNLIPRDVVRLSGNVSMWSGLWTNNFVASNEMTMRVTTNQMLMHVLIVNNTLQSTTPPAVERLLVHATNNIVIADRVGVSRQFLLEAKGLCIDGELSLPLFSPLFGGSIFFSGGSFLSSWGATNVIGLVNYTNRGALYVPGAANFGTDRPAPYSNFVNRGITYASSHFIRTLNFDNPGDLAAEAGPIMVDSPVSLMQGEAIDTFTYDTPPGTPPSVTFSGVGSLIECAGDVGITSGALSLSNAVISSGSLINDPFGSFAVPSIFSLRVTNMLRDAGPSSMSYIWNNGGVNVSLRPASSDLMGTTLILTAGNFEEFFNVWAGEDRGPNTSGYSNNLALGRLVLNYGVNSLNYFTPLVGGNGLYLTNAMYVDYLELLNQATNFLETIAIDQNFTIYFANANLDPALIESASGGRMRWVSSFVGPFSSADYTAANGKVSKVNSALLTSTSVDSDGDGVMNAYDSTPFYTADDAVLSVSLTTETSPSARLSWRALAQATNTVEYTAEPGSGDWQVLTNFVQGAVTAPVSILDPLSPNGALRVYRLRVTSGAH